MTNHHLNHLNGIFQDESIKLFHNLDVQFSIQRKKHFKIMRNNDKPVQRLSYDSVNDINKLKYLAIEEQNSSNTFPSICPQKSSIHHLQQNNNCNSLKNQRLSLSLDSSNDKIPSSHTIIDSKTRPFSDQSGYIKEISKVKSDKFILLSSKFSKANAILTKEFEQYRLPIRKLSMDKIIAVPQMKPPPSPYSSNLNDYLRNNKVLLNTKIEKKIVSEKENKIDFKYKKYDDSVSVTSESVFAELDDLDQTSEEIELLDNLDSDMTNENLDSLRNRESPSEDILKEVHRLVNTELINSNLSNQPKSPFINSLFTNIPPVIRFVREGESVSEIPPCYRHMLIWRYSQMTPNVVKRAVKRTGFKLTAKSGSKWIGYFGSHMKSTGFKSLCEHQKINHMPGSFQIGRKDKLWRNVTLLASKKSKLSEFNFLPKTYCLPGDLKVLKGIWDDEESKRKAKWILKPPASARGIGVRVISKWSQVPKKRPALIQSYVSRPFLINDSKFDLRVYVAITSCDPLRIYVYKEGLVRFASHKYSKSSKHLSNRFVHLTNYSVNKKNSSYEDNEDHNKCQGHKWTLQTLWKHFVTNLNIDWKPIWKSIKDCVVKTIISVEAQINSNIKMFCTHKNCVYELFGFDILLDHHLKPWVLEVNISPSLHSNTPLDIEVKSSLIADLFNMVGFQLFQMTEDSIQSPLPSSQRTSISTSSIPNSVSRSVFSSNNSTPSPDKKFNKSFQYQSSLSALNKPKLEKCVSTKSVKQSDEDKLSRNSKDNLLDLSIFQQRKYFNRPLTPNEKAKHKFYIQKPVYDNPAIVNTITDKLTVDDVRILIESIDEFNRAGNFELAFPIISEELDSYISYINTNSVYRYYNCLLTQFMKKYRSTDTDSVDNQNSNRNLVSSAGLQLLNKFSNKLYGIVNNDSLWSPPVSKELARSKLSMMSNSTM